MNLQHVVDAIFGTSVEWRFVRAFVYISLGSILWQLRPVPAAQRAIQKTQHHRSHRRSPHHGWWTVGLALALTGLLFAGAYSWRTLPSLHKVNSLALTSPVHINSGPPYVGVFEPGEQGSYKIVNEFATQTGMPPQIILYYSSWNQSFDAQFARMVRANKAIPFVELLPNDVSMSSITDGMWDSYLRSYAAQVRQFGSQVIIGFAPEMNGNWYSWGYGKVSSTEFVAAWRHVVNTFRSVDAKNVTWLWTVSEVDSTQPSIKRWWPGSNYVTWAGVDGYYYRPTDTFNSVFGLAISQIRAITDKPLLIPETAVGPGSRQPAQIKETFQGVRKNHLLGMVWFDQKQADGPYHLDWRLEGDKAGISAFRQGVQDLRTGH
jgi:glycosyl hydrolase family 26